MGAALALLVWGALELPQAEASKVSMRGETVRKAAVQDANWVEKDVTSAEAPRDRGVPEREVRPSSREPLRWDALPEKERKSRTVDELLGKLAEV